MSEQRNSDGSGAAAASCSQTILALDLASQGLLDHFTWVGDEKLDSRLENVEKMTEGDRADGWH